MSALSVFALRLAAGMTACLLLLSPADVNPRFYRVHFLTALGLTGLAALFAPTAGGWPMWTLLAAGMVLRPGRLRRLVSGEDAGRTQPYRADRCSRWPAPRLRRSGRPRAARSPVAVALADLTSAAVLGSALSAMLMGHSYLIAPSMSLRPLLVLIGALAIAVAGRMAVDGADRSGPPGESIGNLDNERILLLLVRWAVGFAGVLGLTWMAWQTARIRSTQSATGILYVVVIFCFLGELTEPTPGRSAFLRCERSRERPFPCPACEQAARLETPLPAEWSCPKCDRALRLNPENADPTLTACAVCGDPELYRKKDFPHGLGLAILTLACLASTVTYFSISNGGPGASSLARPCSTACCT